MQDESKPIVNTKTTDGTTMYFDASLDDDSKFLYSVGPTNFEPTEVSPFSSSNSNPPTKIATTWEDILKTVRL